MTVPAPFAGDVIATHCPVTGDNIFYGAGDNVAVVGKAGGEGWAVVEGEGGVILVEC